ncbi:unnamed protein product, partial [Didymodactylos carnosus]
CVAAVAFMPLDGIDELWCNVINDYLDLATIKLVHRQQTTAP